MSPPRLREVCTGLVDPRFWHDDTLFIAGLDITYVAEYQENLHNVYVMLRLGGTDLPVDIEVEILPTTGVPIGTGDRLLVKVGASCSPPLSLPVPVQLGKQSVRAVDESFEFRILVLNNNLTNGSSTSTPTPSLMDASQLEQLKPQTFTCTSCSLPLVQSSRIEEFKDLPSEHWSELLDAWVCHQDQELSERLVRHGSNGFWPEEKQCLIGGSYLLFDDAVMVRNSLRISEEEIKVRLAPTPIPPRWKDVKEGQRSSCGHALGCSARVAWGLRDPAAVCGSVETVASYERLVDTICPRVKG